MLMESKSDVIKNFDMDFLVHFSYITKLLKGRNYFTKQDFVNGLSRKLNTEQCQMIFDLYSSGYNVHDISNKFLLEFNSHASIIKKLFVTHLFYHEIKNILNDIIFFEFSVGNARTDVNRINGFSYAFEIKTGRDRPNNAEAQTRVFSDFFEFVFLIVNNEEPYSNISENIGIIKYEYTDGEMLFDYTRKPKRNQELNSFQQLNSLSKSQLLEILGTKKNINEKEVLIKNVIQTHSEDEVNTIFKTTLKNIYRDKWKMYIQQNIIET